MKLILSYAFADCTSIDNIDKSVLLEKIELQVKLQKS